jgi:hypothetical protein
MKNQTLKFILTLSILLIISCNNKKETTFTISQIFENYSIELPNYLNKIDENHWEIDKSYFLTRKENNLTNTLKEELTIYSNNLDKDEFFNGKELLKNESFKNGNIEGELNVYKKEFKGKGLGLVSFKTYIIFAFVKDDLNTYSFNTFCINEGQLNDFVKSIKSFNKNAKTKNEEISFDYKKAEKEGYQIFIDENFIIKCKGNILFDKARFENDQQSGQANYSKPYHVFKNGIDYNLNISDMSSLLKGKNDKEISQYNDEDLKYYQTKFDEMGIKNEQKKFKDFNAVFYENLQDGKLSKAIYFHNDMKSYMLQVTSKTDTKKLFEEFINSFGLIKK